MTVQIGAEQMKDEIFFRDKLEDEWEANEVYAILSECDKDFEPPLSERGSTVQKTWEKKSGDGVRNYFNEVAKQHTLLLKRLLFCHFVRWKNVRL